MNIKNFIHNIHLILGLLTGIVVFIVAITGCLYVFKAEVEGITQTYRNIDIQDKPYLPPSQLKEIAQEVYPGKELHGIAYHKPGEAAEVLYYEPKPIFYQGIIINPYSGEIIRVKDYTKDFFYLVFLGHFQLWLPRDIGQPMVAWSILIFILMLLTGIVLWWPKKQATAQSFKINWKNPWKRRLFDMHSVFGFYAHLILLVIALTGLVWGFKWFSKGLYKATGGEKELAFNVPESKSPAPSPEKQNEAIDWVWDKMMADYPNAAVVEMHFPHDSLESVYAHVNPSKTTYWKTEFRYFDQSSLEELEVESVWGKMENASLPDKIRRMNYDIHIGAIGGFPGKIIAFLASLIAASLPVTGFLMWRKKQKERKKLKLSLKV